MIYVEMMADRTDKITVNGRGSANSLCNSESPSNQPSSEYKSLIEIYANDLDKVDFVNRPPNSSVNSSIKENTVWLSYGWLRLLSCGWLLPLWKRYTESKSNATATVARVVGKITE